MDSTEIVLFTVIVFLFIIAIFMFVLLRKSFEKRKLQEQKKFEYKDIVNITPEFKFETSTAKEIKNTIPSEDKYLKTNDKELEEILIAEPKIIESPAENKEPLAEDYSGLKLEDTLVDIEEEKKERKKIVSKKPEIKITEKDPLKKRKKARKKKEIKEKSIEVEMKKESKEESIEVETKKES